MEVVLYQSPGSTFASKQELDFYVSVLPARPKTITKAQTLNFGKIIGYFMLIFSVCGVGLFAGPILAKEISFRAGLLSKNFIKTEAVLPKTTIVDSNSPLFEQIPEYKQDKSIQPVDTDFGIVIPKLNINAKITSNVDININPEINSALKKGVAHASGSALPGQGETIYLFAHSAFFELDILRMNAVFYQIKDLQINDEINIYYKGKLYIYKVYGQKVVKPSDVASITDRNEGEQLVLQTCWPIGSTKERLLVFAKPVN